MASAFLNAFQIFSGTHQSLEFVSLQVGKIILKEMAEVRKPAIQWSRTCNAVSGNGERKFPLTKLLFAGEKQTTLSNRFLFIFCLTFFASSSTFSFIYLHLYFVFTEKNIFYFFICDLFPRILLDVNWKKRNSHLI